jgi:serine/threonine protein phosphatase PrpC
MMFLDNQTNSTHSFKISSKINQLSKGQDHIYIDDTYDLSGEKCSICIVFDGHGDDKVIDFISSIPKDQMNKLLIDPKPVETLANYINENVVYNKNSSSGSTMCMVKVYSNRIECINCGDSQVAIYKNGSLHFISKEHNYKNKKERNRLTSSDNINFVESGNIKMINTNTLISVYSEYIEWDLPNRYMKLACTQALGHNNMTGYDPDYTTIPLTLEDNYKVIIGSDGLWDMVMVDNEQDMNRLYKLDAEKIVERTTFRWLQDWNMQDLLNHNQEIIQCKFTQKQCDDIAVVVVDIIPE